MMRVFAIALALVFATIMPSQLARTMGAPGTEQTLTLTQGYAHWNEGAQLDTSQVEGGQATEPWDVDTATDEPGDTTPDDGEEGCAVVYADDLPNLAIDDLMAAGWQGEQADGMEALYAPGCFETH